MERRRNHTAVCNYIMGKSREDIQTSQRCMQQGYVRTWEIPTLKTIYYLSHEHGQTLEQGPKDVEDSLYHEDVQHLTE